MESQFFVTSILPLVVLGVVYFGSVFLFEAIGRSRHGQKFKIQSVQENEQKVAEMHWIAMRNVTIGYIVQLVVYPVSSCIITLGSASIGKEMLVLTGLLLIADATFYWSHRLLHHRYFYVRCHKLHHSCHSPVSWTSLYVDYGEFVIAILSSFLLPLWVVGAVGVGVHYATYSAFIAIIAFSLVMSHSGLKLPLLDATHHDNHHKYANGNYGSRVGVWDWMMGTTIDVTATMPKKKVK